MLSSSMSWTSYLLKAISGPLEQARDLLVQLAYRSDMVKLYLFPIIQGKLHREGVYGHLARLLGVGQEANGVAVIGGFKGYLGVKK